jgi:cytochrome b subunit of formate dehydrogenase
VHHVAAFLLGILFLYHIAIFVDRAFVQRRFGKMLPAWSDLADAVKLMKFNMGLVSRRPLFDRFNFEQKAEYWALILGIFIMGVTGIVQMFPAQLTLILPVGWVIPASRAAHFWQAVLMVLAVLSWHFYHTVFKKLNLSIFNGKMTIDQMQEEHPLELDYLEQASAAIENRHWPLEIEIRGEKVKDTGAIVQIEDGSVEEIVSKNHIEGNTD